MTDRVTIAVPKDDLDDAQLAVLWQITIGKEPLLKWTFLAESLGIEVPDEQTEFLWFSFTQDTGTR